MKSPIHVGMVGAGWMGRELLARFAARQDVVIVGLHGPDATRCREALAGVGLPGDLWVADYEQLLKVPELEAVCIASPNAFHGPQSLAALAAGKHVFCEKPSATRFDEFRRQVEWERTHPGQQTLVDYILYFDTFEERLRRMVATGVFGTVTQIQVNYRHPVNITGRKVWKLDAGVMGDAIGMGVIHALSAIVMIMQSQTYPVRVYATANAVTTRGFAAPPLWNIQVTFANGACGFCFGNIDHGLGFDASHHVHGTAGALVFDSLADRANKVRYWSATETAGRWVKPLDQADCDPALVWPAETTTPDSGDVVHHQTGAVVRHFIECIQTGQASPLSFANAARITELGWAAQMSAARGQPVDLPLDVEAADRFFAGGAR